MYFYSNSCVAACPDRYYPNATDFKCYGKILGFSIRINALNQKLVIQLAQLVHRHHQIQAVSAALGLGISTKTAAFLTVLLGCMEI